MCYPCSNCGKCLDRFGKPVVKCPKCKIPLVGEGELKCMECGLSLRMPGVVTKSNASDSK